MAAWSASSSCSAMPWNSASPSTSPWYALARISWIGSSGPKIGTNADASSPFVSVSVSVSFRVGVGVRVRVRVRVRHPADATPGSSPAQAHGAAGGPAAPDRRGAGGTSSVMCVAPMATVLMPIPARDFDPTEVAVTWQVLTGAGHRVVFATPSGQPGAADELMVTGRGLDPWGLIPGLRNLTVVGRVLRADAAARAAYAALVSDEAYGRPLPWGTARRSEYDALGAARRAPGPGDARLPREPRGPADGGRCLRRRQARRRHLPRGAGGRPSPRSADGALRPARPRRRRP